MATQKINKNQVEDTGWIDLPLSSGVTIYASDTVPKYRKVGNHVYLKGAVKPTSTATSVEIGYMPEGMWPAHFLVSTVCQGSGNERWHCAIYPNGRIMFERYSGTVTTSIWLPFNVSYVAD